MSSNPLKAGKFFLIAGLLLVLAQGLWDFPGLQDYLFPGEQMEANLQVVSEECGKIEAGLTSLKSRMDYLNWFLVHRGTVQKVSLDRMLAFPFSESIRPLSPGYFWHGNIYLAQKARVNMERKIKYLGAFLKYLDANMRLCLSHQDTDKRPPQSGEVNRLQQIQEFQRQLGGYDARLKELRERLTWLENNDSKT
jgi:hypothetical protein